MMMSRRMSGRAVVLSLLAVALAAPASAVTSDRAAAIVEFPLIAVGDAVPRLGVPSGSSNFDTMVQLGNVSDLPVNLHCFYENANAHCTNTGNVCVPAVSGCCDASLGCGLCQPGWNEIDFRVYLTPRQPIGWLAADGLTTFPLDGQVRTGVGGSSNSGSRIPPVPEVPFTGALKCIVVDDAGVPLDQNVIKGEATFVDDGGDGTILNVARYNAVGLRALQGAVDDDNVLVLGGPDAEYEGCPSVVIADHFFDFVTDPAGSDPIVTALVLTPCAQDLLRQIPGSTVVQYLVFNEFEQRFSTSRTVDCQQALQLSLIDTIQPNRSIFSAGVAGTVSGQSRLSAIDGGLIGVGVEFHGRQTAAFNLHYQGDRQEADLITLP